MTRSICKLFFCWTLVFTLLMPPAGLAQQSSLENGRYKISLRKDGSLDISVQGIKTPYRFQPEFTLLYRPDNPQLKTAYERSIAFQVPVWRNVEGTGNTADLFETAVPAHWKAQSVSMTDGKISWKFPTLEGAVLEAQLTLPSGLEYPLLSYRFVSPRQGWYAIGYTGAPAIGPDKVNEIFQPLVWQERRFPTKSYVSLPFMCSLPVALVHDGNATLGLAADPSEIPFQFQNTDNANFGLVLRNEAGLAQPMLFSPVPGQRGSFLEAGDTTGFQLRLIVSGQPVFETYRETAQGLYAFRDYRENTTCSLNETIRNMVDYAMNDTYSGWNEELKAPDYSTDVAATVKLVSALHPLSIALVTDDAQVYKRRALPMMEYLLSREKYLFSMDTSARHQSPSHFLKGPAAEISELAALYEISGERTAILKHYVETLYGKLRVLNLNRVSEGASWQSSLARYRMSGQRQFLDSAMQGADRYIAERVNTLQTDFSDVRIPEGGQFWTDFAPKWIDLLELYEETKIDRYLQAAVRGAQLFVEYIWMQPTPPSGTVVVNKGGKVGTYAHQNRINPNVQPMTASEQAVPAWRVAQTGLLSEASTTYRANRAVFLSHYAAYLLRLAYYSGEEFFHDIARSAVVGRYANFPGYSIMGEYTTLYSRPDYPLKSLFEITYNNIYYNHIWPQIALLMDFLVSDAFVRSDGAIDFPHQYAQGYAYLQSKVYGARPGRFYDEENVQLWLPRGLLTTSSMQGNYLAGYGNGKLYLAIMNQSAREETMTLNLNPDVVPFEWDKTYQVQVRKDNGPSVPATMVNGQIRIQVSGGGITALVIDELPVQPQFQGAVLADTPPGPENSYSIEETPLGPVTGMIISMGASLTNAYIWLQATESELSSVVLHYRTDDGDWKQLADRQYPYEFSIPVDDSRSWFEYRLEASAADGRSLKTETYKLELK